MSEGWRRLGRKYWPRLILVATWLLVVATNLRPGTRLTGWDNLHPELNVTYDIWRSLNAVWQEYQGLGLLGGMAHASDLVRQVIILLFGWLISTDNIRYWLLFSQLLSGAWGAQQLFERLFIRRRETLVGKIAIAATGLFYLLNLGTVQNFYVAFEPFYWFFGWLPWLLDSLYLAWRWPDKRHWARFAIVSFLATPLAYIQTNFVVYGVTLLCCSIGYLLGPRLKLNLLKRFKRVTTAAIIVIATNLFWLLPMVYFTLSGGTSVTIDSQINRVSTQDVTLQNQAYANWRDILLLRGYWFSQQDYVTTDNQEAPVWMMGDWRDEAATTFFGWMFVVMLLAGLAYILMYRWHYRTLGIVSSFLAMIFLLLVNQLDFVLLRQIFRSPFTKVVVPLSLFYSLLVGASLLWLEKLRSRQIKWLTFSFYLTALGLYSLPTWSGQFIYPRLRVSVPDDYEQLFAFMSAKPAAARTALLPAEAMYGWQHQTWGYRGIGFYWFGMRQAMLNRAFDVWSLEDEEFYHEMHYARLSDNGSLLKQVLTKYDVRYLIYDASIHQRGRDRETYRACWEKLIGAAGCQFVFNKGTIVVYDCGEPADNYLSTPDNYIVSNTQQTHQFYDPLTGQNLDYIASQSQDSVDLPFAFLYEREQDKTHISYADSERGVTPISINGDLATSSYQEIAIPGPADEKRATFWLQLWQGEDDYQVSLAPMGEIAVNGQPLELFATKYFSIPSLPADTEEIYLDFGTDYTRLPINEGTSSAIVSLGNFDTDQTWRYFAADKAQVAGSRVNVDLEDAIDLTVNHDFWAPWQGEKTYRQPGNWQSVTARILSQAITLESLATDDQDNCDVISRGSSQRLKNGENGYQYVASGGGSFCDTFYSSQLDAAKHSFMLRVEAENHHGLPLTYYFWDLNSQVQSWETRLKEDETEYSFSFPRVETLQTSSFFDVHNSNRSLGAETADNEVHNTRAYIVPTTWLGKIELRTKSGPATPQHNSATVSNVRKTGTSHYQATVSIEKGHSGLIVLNQAWHSGWHAKINGRTLPHHRYDGWANSWTLDSSLCPSGTCLLTISFWPQWLEWLGLAVSIPVFLLASGYASFLLYRRRCQIYPLYRVFAGCPIDPDTEVE